MRDVDPVEELHRIRRQICKKAGGTPADYVRYYLEMDREKVAAGKAAGATKPAGSAPARGKPSRKPARPAARKPGRRRKAAAV